MDLKHLRTLVAIAERGTFAAAGEALGLTQSAVSLHVKTLEADLGAVLFDRARRPPALNARGRVLVGEARAILARLDGLRAALSDDSLSGTLRLGAVPTCLTGVLPAALADLAAAAPNLVVRVESGLSAELAERVGLGDLDAAAVTEPADPPPGLAWRPYCAEPLTVIAPPGTVGDDDRALLEGRPFIRFRRRAWAGRLIDRSLTRRGIHVRPVMEIDTLEGIAQMVAHGLGLSVVPRRPIPRPFPEGLVTAPFGDPAVRRVMGLVDGAANPKARLTRALHAALATRCGAMALPDTVAPPDTGEAPPP